MSDIGKMPDDPGPKRISKSLILVVVGIVIAASAILLNVNFDSTPKTPQTQTSRIDELKNAAKGISAKIPKQTGLPSFDVVRVSPNGDAVFAGRAVPGSTVVILDGDKEIGRVVADSRGEWVFIPIGPLQPGNRSFGLKMLVEGKEPILSKSVVALAVPEHGRTLAGGSASGESQALAVLVPRDGKGQSRVLQKPSTSETALDISIDSVDYDDKGALSISGRSKPGAQVRVYIDNAFVGQSKSDKNGLWVLSPDTPVSPGLHALRADQVDDKGGVLARTEIPFSRAEETAAMKPGSFVVVQPGNSLWRLARRTYGQGVQYTLIFEANKNQIRNPNLIYPGQVFALPSGK